MKPTYSNSRWIRKVKVYPDKKEVKVYGKRWALWGWCHLQLTGEWDWSSGRRLPTLEYLYVAGLLLCTYRNIYFMILLVSAVLTPLVETVRADVQGDHKVGE